MISKPHQPCAGPGKPACVVKRLQFRLEVHMQPLCAPLGGERRSARDKLLPEATPPEIRMNCGVEKKSVQGAIARHFGKSGQPVVMTRGDMAKTGFEAWLKTSR